MHACAEILELQHISGLKYVIVIQFIYIYIYIYIYIGSLQVDFRVEQCSIR